MKVYIVGTGTDGGKTLTAEAKKAINAADVLIGAGRMVEGYRDCGKTVLEEYRSGEIRRFLEEGCFGTAAVLMSGDCGFFSGAAALAEALEDFDTEIICGIASPVYLFSKLKMDWSDCNFVSLHGRSGNIVRAVCAHRLTFFLLGGEITAAQVCQRLCEYGRGAVKVYIGERLGYPDERIISGRAEELTETDASGLCVLLAENPDYERGIPGFIPDESFIRGSVPMTKAEVRCLAVAGLDIGRDDICWDIGGGTGSVSVAMALQCERGRVFSVEREPVAAELIRSNLRKFGCDNIEVREGDAVDTAAELPVPDCVFVGGSGGKLRDIVMTAAAKNSNIRLTVTAVSLETLSECTAVFDELGFEAEITQIAVTRTKKAGTHTMLSAENPVFIIKRKL
ncbi:precorrin-6y C5,15-methyltransferase (decarboxylating) subunit CbiE [uncultured Ruminococcus sp.]|uniref:precorrin-6y C5,15-methyltransferase (decarboxylating) subunit CbiE n=1 Tax=uncultured Ruminococcus sp. TaxID=165186 RepID=UPI0026032CA6|nr:precorrin-6y C5,15-methyltransferase (decarboxylating) subunit CbiE [uncultured Ruminococcus sp.]